MNLLRQKREERGLSQAELARLAQVSQQSISLIEKDARTNPGVGTLYSLAMALDCTIYDLWRPDHIQGNEEE